jgi:hypothetical protein
MEAAKDFDRMEYFHRNITPSSFNFCKVNLDNRRVPNAYDAIRVHHDEYVACLIDGDVGGLDKSYKMHVHGKQIGSSVTVIV